MTTRTITSTIPASGVLSVPVVENFTGLCSVNHLACIRLECYNSQRLITGHDRYSAYNRRFADSQ